MKNYRHVNKKLKGFTIAEVLVVLALTSISITLSYSTLTYIQKLFSSYTAQNKFLNQYTDLKKRMDYEALQSISVIEESENFFTIKRDSSIARLQLLEKVILLKRNGVCDTFKIVAKNIVKVYEPMTNSLWANKLIKSLSFQTEFTKQKFNFIFQKNHEASLKLKLEMED